MSLLTTASLVVTPNAGEEGTLFSIIPDTGLGDMSVTRATTATRVNSAGLVELVPYNLLQYSEDISNSVWSKNAVSVTSSLAPDGSSTAYKLTPNTSNTLHYIYQTNSRSVGNYYTLEIYAKADGYDTCRIATNGNDFGDINLTSLSISLTNATGSVTDVGNGWRRILITSTSDLSTEDIYIIVGTASFAGNGTSGILFWHTQLVEGSTAKDYQKTETRLNIPRLDYSNGTCPSLLVEPQRTNVCLYSEDFTAQWVPVGGGVTPNTTISPSGTLTADTLNTTLQLYQTIPASANITYTISLWVKLGTATNLCLVVNNTAAWNTIGGESFDATDGLNTSTWTRISYTFTTPVSLPAGAINYHIGANGESGLTQSAGTVFIWGAQLEAGSYATSYIPTTSASVTRNADVISKTGISSLIGQTEGTFFVDVNLDETSDFNGWFLKENATFDTFVFLQRETSGRIAAGYYGSGALQARIETAPNQPIGHYKIAFGYKNNDFVMYINGTQIGTDTSGSVSGLMDYIDLHWTQTGTNHQNAAALWKTRLTNDQLEALTGIGFNTYAEMAEYYNYVLQ